MAASPNTYWNCGWEVTSMFFTPEKVLKASDSARVRNLSKFGAFVRRRARSSIKPAGKAGKISLAGEPPRSHSPEPNIRTIFFFYSPFSKSVIIGPAAFNHRPTTSLMRGVVPRALEMGGDLDVIETKIGARWYTGRPRRARPGTQTRIRTIHIKPRPFMRPAMDAEIPGFPDLWADSIRPAA